MSVRDDVSFVSLRRLSLLTTLQHDSCSHVLHTVAQHQEHSVVEGHNPEGA